MLWLLSERHVDVQARRLEARPSSSFDHRVDGTAAAKTVSGASSSKAVRFEGFAEAEVLACLAEARSVLDRRPRQQRVARLQGLAALEDQGA